LLEAVIFDLGGTLVDWPDWDEAAPKAWGASHRRCQSAGLTVPEREYVAAMLEAEAAHWVRVEQEHWSGPPTSLVSDGFRRLGVHAGEELLLAALDGYAEATVNWSVAYDDSAPTLAALRDGGLRIGLLSNTWWAAEWHNADIAAHGLADLIDELAYTSDLPHSKPHPSVFLELAERLGAAPGNCLMVGDRPIDDISGALAAGMYAVWKTNGTPRPNPGNVEPSATITHLAELQAIVERWRA
jgi:putative hydrolase of the HAD superfamily